MALECSKTVRAEIHLKHTYFIPNRQSPGSDEIGGVDCYNEYLGGGDYVDEDYVHFETNYTVEELQDYIADDDYVYTTMADINDSTVTVSSVAQCNWIDARPEWKATVYLNFLIAFLLPAVVRFFVFYLST